MEYFDVFYQKQPKNIDETEGPTSKQHPYYRLTAFRVTKTPLLESPPIFDQSGTFWGEGGADQVSTQRF